MRGRGLARRDSAEDRRVKVLRLTEAGIALRSEIRERMTRPPKWLAALERDDQRALSEILARACELLRSDPE